VGIFVVVYALFLVVRMLCFAGFSFHKIKGNLQATNIVIKEKFAHKCVEKADRLTKYKHC
jgi:hypothetical protein